MQAIAVARHASERGREGGREGGREVGKADQSLRRQLEDGMKECQERQSLRWFPPNSPNLG